MSFESEPTRTARDAEDRQAITDVLFRYARAVDRKDFDRVADCYFSDANDNHGGWNGDIPGLIADMKVRHATIDSSMHYISNVLIELDGDSADVESYCLCFLRQQRDEAAATQSLSTVKCRYIDRFERRSGVWRIADRIVVFDEVQVTDIHDSLPREWVSARRDATDPVFTRIA